MMSASPRPSRMAAGANDARETLPTQEESS
jgi:hypothetical protein